LQAFCAGDTATLDQLTTGKRIQIPEERQTCAVKGGKLARLAIASPPGGGIPAAYAQVGSPLPMP
jgi:hypothetical protein